MRAGAPDRIVVANRFATLKFNVVYGPVLTDVLTRYTGTPAGRHCHRGGPSGRGSRPTSGAAAARFGIR
jgi:hypothetical protein